MKKKKLNLYIKDLKAGAGDSISRLSVIYNFFANFFDVNVVVEKYINYHCKGLDFFERFGVYNVCKLKDEEFISIERGISELFNAVVSKSFEPEDTLFYEISLKNQSELMELAKFSKKNKFENLFQEQLEYAPVKSIDAYFNPATIKIVAHLRRSDILGKFFKPEIERGPIGIGGLHARPLVKWEHIEGYISDNLKDRDVEVILISDGVDKSILKLAEEHGCKEDILNDHNQLINYELNAPNAKIVKRIIGKEITSTEESMDSIYFSDIVISGSSVFPNLICALAKNTLVKVV